MPGAYLWAWDSVSGEFVKVLADASGHLQTDVLSQPDVAQDTPENLKHAPHGRVAGDGAYLPFEVDADGKLQIAIAALEHLNDITDVNVPSPSDNEALTWDDATSKWIAEAAVPAAHDLGGAQHNADTLADLNTKVSDATLDDSGDPRDPNAHKTSHQEGGTDEINVAGLSGELADDQPVKSHTIDKHTDVTRTLFVPVGFYAVTGTAEQGANRPIISLPATGNSYTYISFSCPNDFVSFGSLKVCWITKGDGTAGNDWVCDPDAYYSAGGEGSTTHSEAPTNTTIDCAAQYSYYETEIGFTLSSLAKGDNVGVAIVRKGDDAADTWEGVICLVGLLLTYTAEQ